MFLLLSKAWGNFLNVDKFLIDLESLLYGWGNWQQSTFFGLVLSQFETIQLFEMHSINVSFNILFQIMFFIIY